MIKIIVNKDTYHIFLSHTDAATQTELMLHQVYIKEMIRDESFRSINLALKLIKQLIQDGGKVE